MKCFVKHVIAVFIFLLASSVSHSQTSDWPQFRGPESNPVGASARLPKQWSTTENVEWFAELPGRGWSSPIVTGDKVFVTTVTTDGKSKEPQTGTDFSNDFVAELTKQGTVRRGSSGARHSARYRAAARGDRSLLALLPGRQNRRGPLERGDL